jgi:hypothetical protein
MDHWEKYIMDVLERNPVDWKQVRREEKADHERWVQQDERRRWIEELKKAYSGEQE